MIKRTVSTHEIIPFSQSVGIKRVCSLDSLKKKKEDKNRINLSFIFFSISKKGRSSFFFKKVNRSRDS